MPRWALLTARLILAVVVVMITVLSLRPDGPQTAGEMDKLAHAGAYLAVALLLVLSIRPRPFTAGRLILIIAAAAGYGLLIELVQREVGREFELADMIANAIGATVGAMAGLGVRRFVGSVGDAPD